MNDVQVTNGNKFPLRGRFAAQDYNFLPGKPLEISRDAANHIFGLGQPDKTRALNCLGILKAGTTYKEALEVLANISFEEGHMVFEAQSEQGDPARPQHPQQPDKPHPPQPHPGQQPGKPGKDEEHEESEESGGTRPGAPKGPPGGKSEAVGTPLSTASDDLKRSTRKW
jgi:hypothetical protein